MSPTTSGPPSWPRSTPVENDHATCSLPTFSAVICLSVEWRVLAKSPACITHCLASLESLASSSFADTAPAENTAAAERQVVNRILILRIVSSQRLLSSGSADTNAKVGCVQQTRTLGKSFRQRIKASAKHLRNFFFRTPASALEKTPALPKSRRLEAGNLLDCRPEFLSV